jgi:protein ImuB
LQKRKPVSEEVVWFELRILYIITVFIVLLDVLWLGIHFPELAIEALTRVASIAACIDLPSDREQHDLLLSVIGQSALAVADHSKSKPSIYVVNAAARKAGVRPGMTVASARVLCSDLIVTRRDRHRETVLIERIADRLGRFSPYVSIHEDIDRATIVLEIARSLKLFGGVERLLELIVTTSLSDVGSTRFGIAPTPLAAEVLARASRVVAVKALCSSVDSLKNMLAPVDAIHFRWPASINRSLDTLGLKTFGDITRQPLAGLEKRFGRFFVLDLQKAVGAIADVRACYVPPSCFEERIELGFDTCNLDTLLQAIDVLLIQLESFLHFRGAAVSSIRCTLKQSRTQRIDIEVSSRAATRSAKRWLSLMRDRLERIELFDNVFEVLLRAENLVQFRDKNLDLLHQSANRQERSVVFLDRVSTRIGSSQLYRVKSVSEHRPELAWSAHTATTSIRRPHRRNRPLWILRSPKSLVEMEGYPQYNGALTLLAGPERIDTGWWDNKPVARDYFVAINLQQEVCWIFRDYRQGKRWYLHGFFS